MKKPLDEQAAIAVMSMGEALSELSHLRQVIVICSPNRDVGDTIADKLIQVRDKVLVMDGDEYEELAEELKNGKVPDTCQIVPPLWGEKTDYTD